MKSDRGLPIEIPFRTVITVLLTLAFVQIFNIAAPLLLTVVIGGMVAISLDPVVEKLMARG